MGKGRAFWAKYATTIDRRRLGAIAVLLLDVVFLAVFLAPAKAREPEISNRTIPFSVLEPMRFRFDVPENGPSAKPAFYPYSVIPGGAKTASELRNAVANDSIVRAHYADFEVADMRPKRLEKAQAFYVSYRIGNAIFWTKNPLTLHAGESVLTDGSSMVRTRCGNRLSVAPVLPVSKNEPTPEAMESAEGAVLLASIDTPAELPIALPPTTAIASAPTPAAPPVGIFVAFPPFFPVGAGGNSLPPGIPGTPVPPTTPPASGPTPSPVPPVSPAPPTPSPVATPEPSAALLLAVGLSCILLLKKLR